MERKLLFQSIHKKNPWEEPYDQEGDIIKLYKKYGNNEDTFEPNEHREIHLGSPLSAGYNSCTYLSDWQIENYQMHGRDCCSIQGIPLLSLNFLSFGYGRIAPR